MRKLACVIMLLSLLLGILGGCKRDIPPEDTGDTGVTDGPGTSVIETSSQEAFDLLMDELFVKYAAVDSLTLNYNVADPGSFGIAKPDPPTLGEAPSAESIMRDMQENKELRETLTGFTYSELRADQQIVYDMLMLDIEIMESIYSNEDFSYYLGAFYPIAGVHVQMPILMAEFRFYTAEDIDIYLQLLEDFKRFFDDLIEYERERSRRGCFLNDRGVDEVIAHCESFLLNPEENLMIVIFDDKIDDYEGLTSEQRETYKQRNRELVFNYVLPAYETLMEAMRELRGVGAHQHGLVFLPDGRNFVQTYLRDRTGSDLKPEQIENMFIDMMNEIQTAISVLINDNPYLIEGFSSNTLGQIPRGTPKNYLFTLERAMTGDFPAMRRVLYTIQEIHESMQDFMSPAFYLIPALDSFDRNTIYINPASDPDDFQLFTILAHEGYPGHLYQTVYYLQSSPHPIRTIMGYTGYVEGWATYAEYESYFYAGLRETEAMFLKYIRMIDLLFVARIDLGVNVLGWELAQVSALCQEFGITSREVAEEIYWAVVGYPLQYMPYTIGYLEMISMLEEATDSLGADFDAVEFHRFILDFGPAPFPLIKKGFQVWLMDQMSATLAPAA